MVLQNFQNFIEMTSNMIYMVAFVVDLKCPRKIHLNTQWCYVNFEWSLRWRTNVKYKGYSVLHKSDWWTDILKKKKKMQDYFDWRLKLFGITWIVIAFIFACVCVFWTRNYWIRKRKSTKQVSEIFKSNRLLFLDTTVTVHNQRPLYSKPPFNWSWFFLI